MIENPITYGNYHDSMASNCMGYCEACNQEIYFGEEYLDFEGDYLHNETDCIKQYVEDNSMKKVAGE
ncbi:hypothetical protein U9K47_10355 [Bacillus toyonensis]|uniref:hypothetical protein n=1 Tax=Bacillus toyonensis TaxID=155322 RepID=UPI003467E4F7